VSLSIEQRFRAYGTAYRISLPDLCALRVLCVSTSAKTPRHFNISTAANPKTRGHFKDFNPNRQNPRPFQLFRTEF
jgi:hypothetical protein